jgi:uncharacterized protein
MTSIPVILDTNCLVSALIFSRGKMTWLRMAWQNEYIKPLVCKETVSELLRVFHYPKFHLTEQEIELLFADFLPWAEVIQLVQNTSEIQELRDKDDAVFIHLAQQTKAAYLVSGDRHLLELRSIFIDLHIVSPAEFQSCILEK